MGLEVVNDELFIEANGDRPGVDNLLVMITDGFSSHQNPALTAEERAMYKVNKISATCFT